MIDDALEQLAHKAIARRSRRAARKESRRQLRAERKAEHHELRAERKAAPATRVVKTGCDVLHARKRKAIARLDDVVNEMKLEDKDPIIARCDDVLNEMKRKAVRRALRAERKTERERKRERKAVRLALRAERKAERVGRRPNANCEQSEKKAGRGPAPSAPTHYTPFVPVRVQKIAHAIVAPRQIKLPPMTRWSFKILMMLIQSVMHGSRMDEGRHAPRYGTLHNYEFYRTRASEDRDVAQMAVNGSLASGARIILRFKVHQHHPQCPPALPLPPPPPPLLAQSAIVAPLKFPVAPAAIAVPQQPTAPITPAIVASPILPVASVPANRGFPTAPRFARVGTIVGHTGPFEPVVHGPVETVTTSVPCNAVAHEDVRIHDFGSPRAPAMRVVKNGNFCFSASTRQWLPMDSHL